MTEQELYDRLLEVDRPEGELILKTAMENKYTIGYNHGLKAGYWEGKVSND